MAADAEALKNLGNARRAAGDAAGALEAYRQALRADPGYGPALYNAGVVLQEAGSAAEAEPYFARLSALDPGDRDALFRLGSVLAAQGRAAEAAAAFERALAVDAGNPLLWLELGRARRAAGDPAGAREAATRALAIEPGLAGGHNLLGVLLQEEGRPGEALGCYRRALELAPDDFSVRNNLAGALCLDGRPEEALPHFRRALELRPGDAPTHLNLGNACSVLGRREEALRCYEAADRLAPGDPAIGAALLFEAQHVCDWNRLEPRVQARLAHVRSGAGAGIDPFNLVSIPATRRDQLLAAKSRAAHVLRSVEGTGIQARAAPPRQGGRLRLGYLSADFHEHATAYLAAGLFESHDRRRFAVHAYSYGPDDGSAMRGRLRRAFDRFEDVRALAHAQAAAAIRSDGIDILVDLKGYTTYARPEIVALRPAPVQASFLGYPGTMGAPFIDYLVSDAFVTPREHEADYSEKLVILPGTYQVNDAKRPAVAAPPRRAAGLPEGAFVFCCFNQPYKILPEVFARWMSILGAVPGSVLWLLEFNRAALDNLRRAAAERGVDPARLVAAPLRPAPEHLARLGAADLFLDTLPCNAHTSASDALWAGVPVLTCPGDTFASRVAGSLVRAAGLGELAVSSLDEYERLAVSLARDPAALARLRGALAQGRRRGPLFDTEGFTRNLEKAYERIWALHAAGRPPERIEIG